MKRHLKLIAAVTIVMLALTGFQTRSCGGKGSKSSSGSSGGGCSSKKRTGTGGSSGGSSSGSSARKPTAQVTECVRAGRTAATVRAKGGDRSGSYAVHVDFLDLDGDVVDSGTGTVRLESGQTKTVRVEMDSPELVNDVRDCVVDRVS